MRNYYFGLAVMNIVVMGVAAWFFSPVVSIASGIGGLMAVYGIWRDSNV